MDKIKEDVSYMTTLYSNTLRDIVKEVNERGIKKDSIVSLIKDREQFIMVYYT